MSEARTVVVYLEPAEYRPGMIVRDAAGNDIGRVKAINWVALRGQTAEIELTAAGFKLITGLEGTPFSMSASFHR